MTGYSTFKTYSHLLEYFLFGVQIRPSYDFSDIQAGMSGMRSKPAVPWHPVYVLVAATSDIQYQIKTAARKAAVGVLMKKPVLGAKSVSL